MTVTRTSSASDSSITAPKITFAFWSAADVTTSAASFTSKRPMFGPPLTFSRIPVAPSIEDSSSGDDTAWRAATVARLSPDAVPIPISAEPASLMIVRTSAKSRLTRPGIVIRSVIPCTPCRSTSSASLNASTIEVRFSTTWSRRSFSITISVSTMSRRSSIPRSACCARLRPSNENGRVTTPTVSAPSSSPASSPRIGAPPVPVPPPSPAVTKIMSAPLSASLSSSRLSCAAAFPTAGSAPAPRPRVACEPMWIFTSASHISSAWASVFTAMNSTPVSPASTMRLTAFVPPPPTPTTLITARKLPVWSLTLKVARPEALVERPLFRPIRRRRVRGFYSAVNGDPRRKGSTSTCDFRVAACDRASRDRHVDVPARRLHERKHA